MSRPSIAWQARAACAGMADRGLDVWHGDFVGRPDKRAADALAREVCASCPVRAACIDLGVSLLPLFGAGVGIYGGLSHNQLAAEAERRGLPTRKTAQCGTRSAYVGGCSCDDCRRSHRNYERERRVVRRERAVA